MNPSENSQEIRLQDDQATQTASTPYHQDVSRALHAIAAHLHRYTSELTSIEDTINAIVELHRSALLSIESRSSGAAFERVEDGFDHIASQLKAAKDFELELEKKIQNSLALVGTREREIPSIRADNVISSLIVSNWAMIGLWLQTVQQCKRL